MKKTSMRIGRLTLCLLFVLISLFVLSACKAPSITTEEPGSSPVESGVLPSDCSSALTATEQVPPISGKRRFLS